MSRFLTFEIGRIAVAKLADFVSQSPASAKPVKVIVDTEDNSALVVVSGGEAVEIKAFDFENEG